MTFQGLVSLIIGILNRAIIPLIFAIALVLFLYGVLMYISKYDDETRRKEGIRIMTYGIFGLFVMTAVWGLVGLLTQFIGVDLVIPQF